MEVDRLSYCLGMVFAFAEVVGSGVKPLALSPPLEPGELQALRADVQGTAAEFGVLVQEERNVLVTRLFDPAFTQDRAVFLLAADETVLAEHASLKATRERLGERGDDAQERDLARNFGRLLGYSSAVVEHLLEHPRFAAGGAAIPGQ